MNSIFICFIIFNLLHVSLCIDDLDFDDHFITNDDDCIKSYDEGLIKTSYIAKSMRRGLFKCAKEIVYKSTGGSSIEASNFFEIEQRNIIKEMQDLKNFIESSLPMPNVLPAFQWAQSPSEILLNIKFSHKLDAPATLNVEANNVTVTSDKLILSASNGRKNFNLELDLHKNIIPEESSWSMASVGRMTFNLKKANGLSRWSKLTKSSQKMHLWWEMSEKHSKENDKYNENGLINKAEEIEKKTTKKQKEKDNNTVKDNNIEEDDKSNTTELNNSTISNEEQSIDSDLMLQLDLLKNEIKASKKEIDVKINLLKKEKKKLDNELISRIKELKDKSVSDKITNNNEENSSEITIEKQDDKNEQINNEL